MCEADNWTHDRGDQAWKTNRKATNNPQHVEGTRASTWRRLFALRFLLVSPSSALCLVLFFDQMICGAGWFISTPWARLRWSEWFWRSKTSISKTKGWRLTSGTAWNRVGEFWYEISICLKSFWALLCLDLVKLVT